ncbi:MAG: RNase adapter RapZ [Holdemanella sp.]|nr:RNase adapter RapZ [Holdemanella sp.]
MKQNIVLVTGMSGAGKSSAMNALEDLGYYCIDNFPKELLNKLPELFEKSTLYTNIAFSVSALDFVYFYRAIKEMDCTLRTLFLSASDEELLLRYRFTRRLHPIMVLGIATTFEQAIAMEREYFDKIEDMDLNLIRIDTTKMTPASVAIRIRNRFMIQGSGFTVTFQAFGFKHGVPMDADVIIDARFLPNPFYEKELKDKTGNDKEVYDYVMNDKVTQEFIVRLKSYLDLVFSEYESQNKTQMIVCVGCTGGQHRSVSICNWLYETYKNTYRCLKSHRDIGVDEE